jgi:hypothetical protein
MERKMERKMEIKQTKLELELSPLIFNLYRNFWLSTLPELWCT